MVLNKDSEGNKDMIIKVLLALCMFSIGWGVSQLTVAADVATLNTTVVVNTRSIEANGQQIEKLVNLMEELIEQNRELLAYLQAEKKGRK